jgi:hypothetical protein
VPWLLVEASCIDQTYVRYPGYRTASQPHDLRVQPISSGQDLPWDAGVRRFVGQAGCDTRGLQDLGSYHVSRGKKVNSGRLADVRYPKQADFLVPMHTRNALVYDVRLWTLGPAPRTCTAQLPRSRAHLVGDLQAITAAQVRVSKIVVIVDETMADSFPAHGRVFDIVR